MSLCLNMIVKDESHIIEQTLENIVQHFPITYWVVSDTGSSDHTIEIVKNFFNKKQIQGEIHQAEWRDFSYNRNLALKACQDKADYVLIFDADDHVTGQFTLPVLSKDAYYMYMSNEQKSVKYLRKLILKNNGQYLWRGVLHEFLENKNETEVEEIAGDYAVISGRKGNRSFDPDKYLKDAQILEKAFALDLDDDFKPRYAFYCAQSYRDANRIEDAIRWYQQRIDIDQGWFDERYYSFEQLGLLYERQQNYKDALLNWQKGIELEPLRAECWYHIARRHSWNGHLQLAYCFAKQASDTPLPEGNRLFLNNDIYRYWSLYEWCQTAYKLGKLEESYQVFKRFITRCPEDLMNRLSHQMKDYRELILKDHFENIQKLGENLNRFDQRHILEDILKNSA